MYLLGGIGRRCITLTSACHGDGCGILQEDVHCTSKGMGGGPGQRPDEDGRQGLVLLELPRGLAAGKEL